MIISSDKENGFIITNRNNQLQLNNISQNTANKSATIQATSQPLQNLLTGKAESNASKSISTNANTITGTSAITYSASEVFANYKNKTDVAKTNDEISSSQSVSKMDVAEEKEEQLKQPEVKAAIQELQATEQNVRAHEQAHKAAGAGVTGAISYSYTTGPDGKKYISGGEVSVGASGGSTPEETLKQLEQVKRAALAPADPSPQDLSVAASTSAQMMQVRGELTSEKNEELNTDDSEKESMPVADKDVSKESPLGSIASTVDQTASISSELDTSSLSTASDSRISVRQSESGENEQRQSIQQDIEKTMIERAYNQATSKYKLQMDMAEKGLTQQPMFSHIA